MKPQKQKRFRKKKTKVDNFIKYSGIGIQMGLVIGAFVYGGVKLDERRAGETPVFTIILSLFGVFSGIYLAVKDFIKKWKADIQR